MGQQHLEGSHDGVGCEKREEAIVNPLVFLQSNNVGNYKKTEEGQIEEEAAPDDVVVEEIVQNHGKEEKNHPL